MLNVAAIAQFRSSWNENYRSWTFSWNAVYTSMNRKRMEKTKEREEEWRKKTRKWQRNQRSKWKKEKKEKEEEEGREERKEKRKQKSQNCFSRFLDCHRGEGGARIQWLKRLTNYSSHTLGRKDRSWPTFRANLCIVFTRSARNNYHIQPNRWWKRSFAKHCVRPSCFFHP